MNARVASLRVGGIRPLGPEAVPSAIVKHPVAARVAVGPLGLDGDAQADLSVHGGPDKAVYAYPWARYADWATAFPALAARFVAGGMGENLTIDGLVEDDLCVGDVHGIGDALLQVCQPRQPCFKLALLLGEPRVAKHMVRTGHCGWYYRVVRPGTIGAGDAVTLVERPNPDAGFPWLVGLVNGRAPLGDDLARLRQLAGLAESVRRRAGRAASDG